MARSRTFRTEAIVLRRQNIGEADRILTLYTKEFGKMRVVAKGAGKPQSRKTGHVELFMRTNFLLAKGNNLDLITQAELLEAYPALRTDLVRTTYAAYLTELLDKFTPEEDKHIGLYDLLALALHWLENTPDLRLVARYYELRLLAHVGYQPQLFRCVATNTPIQEEDQWMSVELGGLLKPNQRHHDRRAYPVDAVTVKILRYLQSQTWNTVKVLTLTPPVHYNLENIMHHYLTHILERNLKSVDFLRRLREEAHTLAPLPPTNT